MHDQRPILVADAPVNWGIYEFDPIRPPGLTGDVFLGLVQDGGYDGVELGSPGFLGDAQGTCSALSDRDQLLAGAYADPVSLLHDYRTLVRHVHLKDVAPDVLAASRDQHWSMDRTWAQGVFCDLGQGEVPIASIVAEFHASGYLGWAVVEQDQEVRRGESPDQAALTSRANRDFLAANGLPLSEHVSLALTP